MEGGGAERQLTYLSQALERNGCDVHVALNAGGPNLPALEASGATVHRLEGRGNHDPRMLARLCQIIKRTRPDLVQCWLLQMEVVGGLASLATRTPWVFSERSSQAAYPPSLKHRLRVAMASRASAIVANSSAGDEYWRDRTRGLVPRYVIPNALPLDAIRAAPMAAVDLSVGAGAPLILFAGRLDECKNPELLVEALRHLPSGLDFRALFCGEGPRRAAVERLLVHYGLERTARVAGYTGNLWGLMKRARVIASLSRFEGSPNVVLEAMACGCPLVVSDIPAHREILDEGTALFVDVSEVAAVVDGLSRVLADPGAALLRARAAQVRAERHALPRVAQQYLKVYSDVLERRGGQAIRMAV